MKIILRTLITGILWLILWPYMFSKVFGNKPKSLQNTIIIANHYSNLDPFIIKSIFRKEKITFVATTDVKKRIWSRVLTWAFDTVYVDSNKINYSFFKQSIDILKRGGSICIFPEGYVNPRKYGFLDFKRSYAMLAIKAQANVLPIYMFPQDKMFKKNEINLLEMVPYESFKNYKDSEELNMYFFSMILESSSK